MFLPLQVFDCLTSESGISRSSLWILVCPGSWAVWRSAKAHRCQAGAKIGSDRRTAAACSSSFSSDDTLTSMGPFGAHSLWPYFFQGRAQRLYFFLEVSWQMFPRKRTHHHNVKFPILGCLMSMATFFLQRHPGRAADTT